MSKQLDIQATEFYDCDVKLSSSRLDAQQLGAFTEAQMPRTGIGAVPWSTPISPEQLSELASAGKAEFVTARMMLAYDGDNPLVGIGALVRDEDNYRNPRMIIVVDSESRGQGLGNRIAHELLNRLESGETVEAEVQRDPSSQGRRARFFLNFGFECIDENYRTGDVNEYKSGVFIGSVVRMFALYALTK